MSAPMDPVQPAPVVQPNLVKPPLIAGSIFGLLGATPLAYLDMACCLPSILCGVLAAWLGHREFFKVARPHGKAPLTLMGLAAGALSALVSVAVTFTFLAAQGDMAQRLTEEIERGASQSPFGDDFLDSMPEGAGLVLLFFVASLLIKGLFYTGFGTIGGVLGAAMFKGEAQPPGAAPGEEPPAPPPPKVIE